MATAAVATAALLAAPAATRAEAGLVGQWHLDGGENFSDGSSPGTRDSSGQGNHAYMSQYPALVPGMIVPGRFGNAFDFAAPGAPNAVANDAPSLEPLQVSVTAWVKRASAPVAAGETIVAKGGTPTCGASSYALADGSNSDKLQFYVRGPTGNGYFSPPVPDAAVWNGQWHAVTGTFDGITVRIFLDGVQIPGAATGTATSSVQYGQSARDGLFLGSYSEPGCGGGGRFTGAVDEVRVHGRALGPAEIAALHDAATPQPPNLGGGGGGGPPGITLQTPAGALKTGAAVTFQPSVTAPRPIVRYDWDFAGTKLDVSCNGAAPVLSQSFPRPYRGPVSVTATDITGARSTASATVAVAAGPAPALRARLNSLLGSRRSAIVQGVQVAAYAVADCEPLAGVIPSDVTPNGGPPSGCTSETVTAELVSAIGCFTRVKGLLDLPSAERDLLTRNSARLFREAFGGAVRIAGGGARAAAGNGFPGLSLSPGLHDALLGSYRLSRQPVRINGLDYTPARGAVLVIVGGGGVLKYSESFVVSSNATVSMNGVALRQGPLALRIDLDRAPVRVTDFRLNRDIPFATGLKIAKGTASLDIIRRASLLATHIGLPSIFGGTTADTTIRLSNPDGARLGNFKLSLGEFKLAGVGVKKADLAYTDTPLSLTGSAEVKIAESGPTVGAELVLGGGTSGRALTFQSFKGFYEGPPYIPLFAGVDLTRIDGGFELYPPVTRLTAGATVKVGGAALACPPYTLVGTLALQFYPSVSFDASGSARLFCIPVASGYVHVDDSGYISFGGRFGLDVKIWSTQAQIDAAFLAPHFQAEGGQRTCILGYACLSGRGIISDRGIAACVSAKLLVVRVTLGAGADWDDPIGSARVFTGCDFGRWRTVVRPAQAAGPERRVTIRPGLRAFSLAVVGRGRAPDVELRGPRGEVYSLPASGPMTVAAATGFRSPVDGTAYFAVGKPSAGTWRIVPRTGSSEITEVRTADGLPEPSVRLTRLAARRGQFAYRYAIRRVAGQKVTFVERARGGERRLATTSAAGGVLRFSPSDASGTKRSIVALIEQDGQPRANLTLARFAAAPPRPGRPPRLRARRRGSSLVVAWSPAAKAQSYEARIRLSDGRSLLFTRAARARSFTVRGVARSTRATVRVAGVRGRSRTGPATLLRVPAAR